MVHMDYWTFFIDIYFENNTFFYVPPKSNSEICFSELSTVPGLNPVMPAGAMYIMVSVFLVFLWGFYSNSDFQWQTCVKLCHIMRNSVVRFPKERSCKLKEVNVFFMGWFLGGNRDGTFPRIPEWRRVHWTSGHRAICVLFTRYGELFLSLYLYLILLYWLIYYLLPPVWRPCFCHFWRHLSIPTSSESW